MEEVEQQGILSGFWILSIGGVEEIHRFIVLECRQPEVVNHSIDKKSIKRAVVIFTLVILL